MKDRVVILGGTGTVGKAITRHLLDKNPNVSILIFSRDEIKQLEMMDEFPQDKFPFLQYALGDVRDISRLKEVLVSDDQVIHAAAIKHVVMAENNPGECLKTNVLGTENVITASLAKKVRRTLLISTDKAERPIGVYGKSKLEAEQLFQRATSDTCFFGIVRLGNIIGARGSVFEAFEKQRKSGVIQVTHPEATRFCISQEDAAEFILKALKADNLEILIPKMNAFKVIELAKKIAPECKIEIVGLRPGDKLHEELNDASSSVILQKST